MAVVPVSLNIDWSDIALRNPRTITDGTNGIAVENYMRSKGFKVNSNSTLDLPNFGTYGIEIKSRGIYATTAPWTIGTMTEPTILKTPWEKTTFKRKMTIQFHVLIGEDINLNGIVTDSYIVDFRNSTIQELLRDAYELARENLRNGYSGTASGTRYGMLEHRTANSYAFRIPPLGMKNITNSALIGKHPLFEFS
jgi:hypothetical protein